SFVAEGDHGIDAHGAARGSVAGRERANAHRLRACATESFVAEGDHGIDAHGAARGSVAGRERANHTG
ncbi:MAG: hypothetical protein WBD87_15205, partial [Candidatus Acidiferrales bacterium]